MMMIKAIQIGSSFARASGLQQSKQLAQAVTVAFSSQNNDSNNNGERDELLKKGDKFGAYIHKTNYNLEQHSQYTQNVKSALKELEDEAIKLENSTPFELLPRRKRRVYDRPRIDLDITNYGVWRVYDRQIYKVHKHAAPVVCKINISPRLLRHAFGEGQFQTRNDKVTTREFDFEDSNMDTFLVYDYKATTEYQGAAKTQTSEEENNTVKAKQSPYPTAEQFWNSDEPHMFRVNCSNYADFHKFRKWIITEVEKRSTEKSYEDKMIERFGPFELYNKYEQKYELDQDPSVFKFDRTFYLEKGKKYTEKEIQANPYLQPLQPAKQMDDKHRVLWPYQWNPKPTNP